MSSIAFFNAKYPYFEKLKNEPTVLIEKLTFIDVNSSGGNYQTSSAKVTRPQK